ncbi:MAG: class I SAM-dependent methyltransferase [Chloroflexi bacterium]|nr:class I SAM-dependent methyltransferase [Chloroflexota bacterium]
MRKQTTQCWCGNPTLQDYSPTYWHCQACDTLILKTWPVEDTTRVDDAGELYSKDYYLKHLPESFGYPSLDARTRADLTDRIPYWTRTLLKYRLPPASVLELGSAHGGFVNFLTAAGYQAAGLELSPWLVEFAQKTFNAQLLLGPLEAQNIPQASLDVIAHMDVLEHLPDPVGTMRAALDLLKPDGLMLIQTPCYDPEKSHEEIVRTNHPFLAQYKEKEHLHLFSMRSIAKLFHDQGWGHVHFERAIFSHYDMFAVVTKEPLRLIPTEERAAALQALPSGRLALALLDLYDRAENLQHHADERLKIVQQQSAEIEILRNAAQERLEAIERLDAALKNKP